MGDYVRWGVGLNGGIFACELQLSQYRALRELGKGVRTRLLAARVAIAGKLGRAVRRRTSTCLKYQVLYAVIIIRLLEFGRIHVVKQKGELVNEYRSCQHFNDDKAERMSASTRADPSPGAHELLRAKLTPCAPMADPLNSGDDVSATGRS